ncbi:unnamed protein product [Scytosiphon promiscuus]
MVAAVAAALKEKPDDYDNANVSPSPERQEESEGSAPGSAPPASPPSGGGGGSSPDKPSQGEELKVSEKAREESRLPREAREPPPTRTAASATSLEDREPVALAPAIAAAAAAAGIGGFTSRTHALSAISAARAQPAAETDAERTGSDSPGVARYPGSSTDGSWNEQGGRGASPLVGLSFAHSPRSALSLSDDMGGGGGDSSSGTASVATGAGSVTGTGGSSHSSGELSYSPNPPSAAARALAGAAERLAPAGEWVEGGASSGGGGGGGRAAAVEPPTASTLSDPERAGAPAQGSVGRHDGQGATGPGGGANLLVLEGGEAGASPDAGVVAPSPGGGVDRGRGAGHRSDLRAGSTSGSPSPSRQGQQEGFRGHRDHLLPLERGLP